MVGRIENPGGLATGQGFRHQPPRTTCSPLNRAWLPMEEAGSLWVRLRVPFARRRFAEAFNAFQAFVQSFSTEVRRPLKAGKVRPWPTTPSFFVFWTWMQSFPVPGGRPAFFRTVPGYRRRHAPLRFREWLVLHERQLRSGATHASPSPNADRRLTARPGLSRLSSFASASEGPPWAPTTRRCERTSWPAPQWPERSARAPFGGGAGRPGRR